MDSAELRIRVGVAHLMATYQFLADSGKIRQLAALFAADAVFETNNTRYVGPDGILGFFAATKDSFLRADFLPARHYLSSIYVDARTDGSASTYACFQFVGSRGLDHWGTYRDEVVPVGDGWRFVRRQATVEGCVPESPVRALLGLAL
ncbi:polyketide cyclase [Mycobacterium colombiense]|uniref:nuclear transport factor 2 family protein n=1 Tax=Mycobacterium colombiense TaxID=339268 RepID=UPI0007EF8300|nr:nuclear transport factor 2 family protein [Mycobacterium colombiense]OBK66262.1 polyketide cyclase [Mycobacterium colombiense]